MNNFAKKLIESYKGIGVEVFIDDANIFHSQKETNIWIDWGKFDNFLKSNFKVQFIKYYRGKYPKNIPESAEASAKNRHFINKLKNNGFEIIERDLKKIFLDSTKNKFIFKCDFDGEIGFDIAHFHKPKNLVIIVSGDSDFVFVKTKNIDCIFICFEYKAPWEIRHSQHIFIEDVISQIKKAPLLERGEHYKDIVT